MYLSLLVEWFRKCKQKKKGLICLLLTKGILPTYGDVVGTHCHYHAFQLADVIDAPPEYPNAPAPEEPLGRGPAAGGLPTAEAGTALDGSLKFLISNANHRCTDSSFLTVAENVWSFRASGRH